MIVCKYKFDSNIYNNLIPEFNSGYNGYSVSDTVDGNIITRTIECDTLPTLMRFGQIWADGEVQEDYTRCLLEVLDMNTSELTNCYSMFRYCTNLTSINCNWNTNKVTNMHAMFTNCKNLTQLDVSNFDTSKVTNMYAMFSVCANLTQLDVSNFDTSNVTNMGYMFSNCNKSVQLDVSNFDTRQVTDMGYMFNSCNNLTQLNVSNFNTSNVTNMQNMFYNCSNLTQLDLSNFDTSNVINMRNMFYNCNNLTQLDVSNFNTSNVTSMYAMFSTCRNLTQLDLSNFNTSNVASMRSMFNNCTNLTSLDISNFNTSNVTNMYTMFQNCNNLTQLDLSNFNTSKVTDMDYMFNNTSKLVNIGMIYCNENTVLKIKEAITNGNVNIWIDENIILPNNTNYVTFKHFKECNKTLYLNSPLLEGDTIEEIEGKIYHVKRYEKIVLDGNENLVNFEEKENTCFVNVIYSPLGKQQGNLICDKFVIGEAYDNDIECIDLHAFNSNLHFNIAKSKLNKISVQGILEYLQQNPVTIVYELAEPIYELVSDDSLLLDSYSGGNLSLDTNITLDKISFTSYEEELAYLYPNTLYTVQFYANNDGIGNVMLGGSLLENKEIVRGLNNIHITTPNVLSNNKLNISTTSGNIYISNVVVTNTGMEFNYFEGMKSTFEDMYIDDIDNKYYGKYKVECKIVGKNKFDKTDFTLYKLWREDGTIGGESVQNGASKLLPVTPNTKYKCSNNEGWNQVLYFDKNKKYIGNEVSGRTNIITPSNCYYIGVNLRITALDIFQIEEGTIATEYTPYREYNTAVYLNSPLLQGDKIMVKDNKLCHYHKMGIREYQEGDLDNYITDLINTIYLLTEPYYEDITPIQSSFVIPTVLEGDMEILTNLPIKSNITYMTNITSAVMLERQLDEIDSGTNSLSDILDGEINE